MYSIQFPYMFSINKTNMVEGLDATKSNLSLLLASEKRTLFGDPYFGTLIRRFLFEQNNQILRDIIVDEIYTSIITFMPQLSLKRGDISLHSDGVTLSAKIKCTNVLSRDDIDFTLVLFKSGE